MLYAKNKILSVLIFMLSVGSVFAQGINWVYIDMDRIFQGYYKTIKENRVIQKQSEIFTEYASNLDKERKVLEDAFNGLRDESQNIALNEEVREVKRNEAQTKFMLLQEKKKEMQEYNKEKQTDMRNRLEELTNKIVKEISDIVKVYSEQQAYDLVIDSSGITLNRLPTFIYLKPDNDITDTILGMINKGHEEELETIKQKAKAKGSEE